MVAFTSEASWCWAFLCWEVGVMIHTPYLLWVCSDFLFLHDSVLVCCMFLGIYPFLLSYQIFRCNCPRRSLNIMCISVASVLMSLVSFLNFESFLFFLLAKGLSVFLILKTTLVSLIFFYSLFYLFLDESLIFPSFC